MAGAIAKPNLRRHLNKSIAKNLTIGIGISIVAAVMFKYGYAEPKKQRYANFYKTYDAEADFRRMRDLGLFQSARPGEN